MRYLCIRQLPSEIKIVLQALQEHFLLGNRKRRRRNLRSFFGRMTREQYVDFKKATKPFSEIEKNLWK